jgi:hypothetical protein
MLCMGRERHSFEALPWGNGKATASQRSAARRAGMHRPFYTDSVYGNTLGGDVGFTADLRGALERVFFQYEVARPAPARARRCHALPACGGQSGGCARAGLAPSPATAKACELSVGGCRQHQRAWHCRGARMQTEPAERVPAAAALAREAVVLEGRWTPHGTATCTSTRAPARSSRRALADRGSGHDSTAAGAHSLRLPARAGCKDA